MERRCNVAPGRYPRGQRGRAVNPLRYRYVGSTSATPAHPPTSASEHSLHQHDVEPACRTCGRPRARCPIASKPHPRAARSTPRGRRRCGRSTEWKPCAVPSSHQLAQQRPADAGAPAVAMRRTPSLRPSWSTPARGRYGRQRPEPHDDVVGRRPRRSRGGRRSARRATPAGPRGVRGTRSNVTVDSSTSGL